MDLELEDYSDISFERNNTKLFISTFTIYCILYFLSYQNLYFKAKTLPNFKDHNWYHELFVYNTNAINAFITGTYGLAYIIGLISIDNLHSCYYVSLGYLIGNITCRITIGYLMKNLKKNIN